MQAGINLEGHSRLCFTLQHGLQLALDRGRVDADINQELVVSQGPLLPDVPEVLCPGEDRLPHGQARVDVLLRAHDVLVHVPYPQREEGRCESGLSRREQVGRTLNERAAAVCPLVISPKLLDDPLAVVRVDRRPIRVPQVHDPHQHLGLLALLLYFFPDPFFTAVFGHVRVHRELRGNHRDRTEDDLLIAFRQPRDQAYGALAGFVVRRRGIPDVFGVDDGAGETAPGPGVFDDGVVGQSPSLVWKNTDCAEDVVWSIALEDLRARCLSLCAQSGETPLTTWLLRRGRSGKGSRGRRGDA